MKRHVKRLWICTFFLVEDLVFRQEVTLVVWAAYIVNDASGWRRLRFEA